MANNSFASYANLTGLGAVKFPANLDTGFDTITDFGTTSDASITAAGVAAAPGASPNYNLTTGLINPYGSNGGWTFTTTPDNISWSMGAEVSPIKIFGSNQVPVTVGSKGMRDLTLGNTLIEGFTRGVQVEDKIAMLEALMNYSLVSGPKGGYVKVPVFQITANNKVYGNGLGGSDRGYFVIKDIQVKETIRDFSGYSTRAFVDVTFTQVPPYQVSSGVDQANEPVTGAKASFPSGIPDPQAAAVAENGGNQKPALAPAVSSRRKRQGQPGVIRQQG